MFKVSVDNDITCRKGEKMEPDEVVEKLKSQFGDKILGVETLSPTRVQIEVPKDEVLDFASFLKHEMGFNYPDTNFGTDRMDDGVIELVWYVGRMDSPLLVGIKTKVDRNNPVVSSMTKIWKGFNWGERETYDMLGVLFEGHPDLRRIYLPEDWDGFPLREDYVYKRPRYRKPEDDDPDYYVKKF